MMNYNKELSIQISLSGFSFQIDTPHRKGGGFVASYDIDSVISNSETLNTIIEWSNSQVMIMPVEFFDHPVVEESLMAIGLLVNDQSERAIYRVCDEYVALWVISVELYDYLRIKFPVAEHTHSLLELINRTRNHFNSIAIDVDNSGVMHIVVWGELQMLQALSVEVTSAEDILFYVRKFSAQYDSLMQYDILLTPSVDVETQKLLSQYYKNIFVL